LATPSSQTARCVAGRLASEVNSPTPGAEGY
jgi:hypothetical protein